MDGVSVNEGEAVDEFAKQMEKKEALEGADLRKLDTFLKDNDGNKVLGNLYRTVTDEGHVKWVCIDHYRVNYQESSAMEFQRVLDSVGGSLSESLGRVEVRIGSRVLVEQFYTALGKARSVYELNIGLDWACTTSDLEALEKALRISREFVKFIGLTINNSSPVCKMTCELILEKSGEKEFGMLVVAIKDDSTLTTLNLESNSIGPDGAQALSEALKTNSTLTNLNLWRNSIGPHGAQAMSEALKTNSTLITLKLSTKSIDNNGAQALSEALRTNSAT
ncbi:hypothetical protein BGZ90_008928, partial [Linnemannia elongata]